MSTFQELAPIISGVGIARSAVENYFSNIPEAPEPQPEPTITQAKIVLVANMRFDGLRGIEKNGGIDAMAKAVNLTARQVKSILKEIEVLFASWQKAQLALEEQE